MDVAGQPSGRPAANARQRGCQHGAAGIQPGAAGHRMVSSGRRTAPWQHADRFSGGAPARDDRGDGRRGDDLQRRRARGDDGEEAGWQPGHRHQAGRASHPRGCVDRGQELPRHGADRRQDLRHALSPDSGPRWRHHRHPVHRIVDGEVGGCGEGHPSAGEPGRGVGDPAVWPGADWIDAPLAAPAQRAYPGYPGDLRRQLCRGDLRHWPLRPDWAFGAIARGVPRDRRADGADGGGGRRAAQGGGRTGA